ncbi:MgtC/SapB family protein [Bacillus sp. FJAT-49736]|uniref:MgtC/SapB family protein n=1 Tax=Bacillus sp. FJAT-49736 TaxID=2833582 RepID=UPI001BC99415|nr:MgtC/SapB family protein [Bacillus sp. FJAT-49736]MBS4173910.1 MgtC/SapB family protein [Bacillus sp. FJAT-49736]
MELIDNQILLKLGISAILGLIIGLERELKRKPAGLKTSLVISITSCLLTIVSIQSAYTFPKFHNVPVNMDPLRLAAQIVSGIGFLGAGVILKKGNDNITGLTTSAMIWGAGAIGIAVGASFYLEAIAGVVLLMISVEIIPAFLRKVGLKQLSQKDIQIKIIVQHKENIDSVISNLETMQITLESIRIRDLLDKGHLIELKALVGYRKPVSEIYTEISDIKDVISTDIEI